MQETLTFPTLDSPQHRYGASSHYADVSEKTSSASTPFVSAPSSPGRMGTPGFYFSAPTSPYWGHRIELRDEAAAAYTTRRDYPSAIPFSWEEKPGTPKRSYDSKGKEDPNSFLHNSDFEFSARFSELDDPSMSPTPMSSANELFCNGQIRPLRIPPRLEQPFSLRQCIHENALGHHHVRPYEASRGSFPCISSLSAPQSPRSLLSGARGSGVFEHSRGSPSLSAPQSPRSPLKEALCNIKEAPSPSAAAPEGMGMAEGSSSGHRRTRSFSPLRMFYREAASSKASFVDAQAVLSRESSVGENNHGEEASCSSQKASRKWTLKDLLHRRSGGENRSNSGRANSRRSSSSSMESSSRGSSHYSCSFSSMDVFTKESHGKSSNNRVKGAASSRSGTHRCTPSTSTPTISCSSCSSSSCSSRATNKGSVSPHELHYMMQKAHAEELRKKTFLPYRQGLLGCLGFSSRSYRTVSNISKTLQSVSG